MSEQTEVGAAAWGRPLRELPGGRPVPGDARPRVADAKPQVAAAGRKVDLRDAVALVLLASGTVGTGIAVAALFGPWAVLLVASLAVLATGVMVGLR